MTTREAALKAWATRRAQGWTPRQRSSTSTERFALQPNRERPAEPRVAGVGDPSAGRLTDYTRLRDGQLFALLYAEQTILESHANHSARAGFIRGVEGSGVGCIAVISGGTFAGGRATMMAGHASRRLHKIECELETRGFDRETIDEHRFGDETQQAERIGIMEEKTHDGDTHFHPTDFEEYVA